MTEGWQGRHIVIVPVIVVTHRVPTGWIEVMSEGDRPFFGELSVQDVLLGNPTVGLLGDRVSHLVFLVLR